MDKMFDLLKKGLEEGIQFHKGNVKLRKKFFVAEFPKQFTEDMKTKGTKSKRLLEIEVR